jgi:uncharacterized protein YjaG (DUF416 family)
MTLLQKFDPGDIEIALTKLPSHAHRLLFGAGVAERLFPNYRAFTTEVGWGDPALLRQALDAIWHKLEGGRLPLGEIRERQAKVRLVTPDSEAFRSALTSAAIDAASAVHEMLEVCFRDDPRRVTTVATFARDTVHMFVQNRDHLDYNDPDFWQRMLKNPLMIRELNKLQSDLDLLGRTPLLDQSFVRAFRSAATYDGRSNLAFS